MRPRERGEHICYASRFLRFFALGVPVRSRKLSRRWRCAEISVQLSLRIAKSTLLTRT